MPRIEIDLPEKFIFTTEINVRVSDLNYGAHVGNDAILTIMHDARLIFYRHLGYKNELSFEGSIGQVVADAAIQYKSQSFMGDVLRVNIAINDFNKYGFDMLYLITNKETGKEIARGKTGIVCFDYAKQKVASIPEAFRNKLEAGY